MIQNYGPIPIVSQNPNYDSWPICTLNCRFLVTPQLPVVFHDFRHWLQVWAPLPRSLPFCPLSLIPQPVAPSPFMRVDEPSCRRRCLKCSGWALFSAASSTISLWLSCSNRRDFRPTIRGEKCTMASYLYRITKNVFPPKIVHLLPKITAFPVTVGPCSNSPLTLTCGLSPSH